MAYSVRRKEPCGQDVGVWAVELLPADLVSHGSDLEASTLFVVEDGRKNARGVEARQAEPVDRPVRSHEGRGVQVPDDPVVLYRLVGHSASSSPVTYADECEQSHQSICTSCLEGARLLKNSLRGHFHSVSGTKHTGFGAFRA